MSNAVIYMHPNGFDTTGKALLGRHSAGESFLRGFVRHGQVDRFHFWNVAGRPQAELEALVQRIEAPDKPIHWIGATNRAGLSEAGVLNVPSPEIDTEAWRRQPFGPTQVALCGITHTTATARVTRVIADLLVAPLEDHDALICTSTAVRTSVEQQMVMMRNHLQELYGQRRKSEPQRVTIPLGVNAEDFSISEADRKAWREKLDIPEDAIVALYVGRFSVKTKMNPALMAMALERAAKRTGKTIYWVCSGWIEPENTAEVFHEQVRTLCPSIQYRVVDGRPPDVRFSIWSVADFFLSFSDNIQETFGLTPVEAMAAGLPSVVSDWDGYKDTVRDGVDGFRVRTTAPRPGLGGDLAMWFAHDWITYENYVGAAAQYTAVDLDAAEVAIAALVDNPDLRQTMGEAARRRVREVFDWSQIIPQYQALWADQAARRQARLPQPPFAAVNAYRPDPYVLFGNYPTRHLSREDYVSLVPGMDAEAAKVRLAMPITDYSRFNRPTEAELQTVMDILATAQGPVPIAKLLEPMTPVRRNFVERGLLWLARYDVIAVTPAPGRG